MSRIAARGGAVDGGAVRGGAVDDGAVDAGGRIVGRFDVMDFIIDQRAARIAAIRETLRPDAEVRAACSVAA